MKKISLIMSLLFMILTFIGAGYVLINHGQVNAGYAVVPMCICLSFVGIYSGQNKKIKKGSRK